jgi:hypothetical protein
MERFIMTEPFRRRPTPRPPSPAALDAFLTGAEPPDGPPAPPAAPWAQGRPDVIKTYVLRLPEPYHMKLQYIAAHTPYSMQRFLQEVVYAAIDQKIAELMEQR